jgi:hypothetical protein
MTGIVGLGAMYEGSIDLSITWSIEDDESYLGAFYTDPTWGDQADETDGTPSGMSGNSYLATHYKMSYPSSSYNGQAYDDYSRVGHIKSSTFRIRRGRMALKIAGGNFPTYEFLALVNAADDRVLFTATGNGTQVLADKVWDLADLVGLDVYLVVADLSTADGACIAVDAVRTYATGSESDAVAATGQDYDLGKGPLATGLTGGI